MVDRFIDVKRGQGRKVWNPPKNAAWAQAEVIKTQETKIKAKAREKLRPMANVEGKTRTNRNPSRAKAWPKEKAKGNHYLVHKQWNGTIDELLQRLHRNSQQRNHVDHFNSLFSEQHVGSMVPFVCNTRETHTTKSTAELQLSPAFLGSRSPASVTRRTLVRCSRWMRPWSTHGTLPQSLTHSGRIMMMTLSQREVHMCSEAYCSLARAGPTLVGDVGPASGPAGSPWGGRECRAWRATASAGGHF